MHLCATAVVLHVFASVMCPKIRFHINAFAGRPFMPGLPHSCAHDSMSVWRWSQAINNISSVNAHTKVHITILSGVLNF